MVYESLSGNTFPTTPATYPVRRYRGPRYVVTSLGSSDGVGGTRWLTYDYAEARLDLEGRGFLGFDNIEVRDAARGLTLYSHLRQDFPAATSRGWPRELCRQNVPQLAGKNQRRL